VPVGILWATRTVCGGIRVLDQVVDPWEQLQRRVRMLEERVSGLRASRRILMNLLSSHEREKRARIQSLERERDKLQRRSSHYAKEVLERNIRIIRLEESVRSSHEDIS